MSQNFPYVKSFTRSFVGASIQSCETISSLSSMSCHDNIHRCKNLDSSTFVGSLQHYQKEISISSLSSMSCHDKIVESSISSLKNLDSSTFVRCSLHHQKEISTRRTKESEPRLKGKQADSSVAHYYHTRKSIEDRIHFTRSFDEASIHKVAKLSETIRVSQVCHVMVVEAVFYRFTN